MTDPRQEHRRAERDRIDRDRADVREILERMGVEVDDEPEENPPEVERQKTLF